MARPLNPRQLTGRDETHLVSLSCGNRLQAEVAQAFAALQDDAREAGFDLAIASSFRSYARQLTLWNEKACGARPVHDDTGAEVDMSCLAPLQQLHAMLRFSAMPGSSRHHWGTDLDVFDAAAMPVDYKLQLTPQEVAPGGMFDPLHRWLDERLAQGRHCGFFRPYAIDRGGVAAERWHLSYAPLADVNAAAINVELLCACWKDADAPEELLLQRELEEHLAELYARYVSLPQFA